MLSDDILEGTHGKTSDMTEYAPMHFLREMRWGAFIVSFADISPLSLELLPFHAFLLDKTSYRGYN